MYYLEMSKHAYIFTINGNLKVVNTCLELLDYSTNDFYILCDSKWGDINHVKSQLYNPCNATLRYISSYTINWGAYSQVSAIISLLKIVIASGIEYTYIHFLQGSDLPIKSNDAIISFFEKNSGKEFVNVETAESDIQWANKCCQWRYFLSHNRYYRNSLVLKTLNFALVKVQQMLRCSVHKNMKFYYGSAIFSITLNFARYLLSQENHIKDLFRWALAPDEKFIQTMLMNSPYASNLYSSNAFLIDWERRNGNSPYVWRIDDFPFLISQPVDMCYARKFVETVDMDIVNALKSHILNEENNCF